MIRKFLRLAAIIGSLPNTIANGQTADAVPLMADLNFIVSQVNTNAAALSNAAILNVANSFTAVQSGLSATSPANFPIASQVQNNSFNTLSSILGTNTISARVAALPLGAFSSGQIFTFLPSQPNNAGIVAMRIDNLGSVGITSFGNQILASNVMMTSSISMVRYEGSVDRLQLISPTQIVSNPFFAGTIQGAALLGSNIIVPLARMQRTEVFSKNAGTVTVNGAVTITTVDLGTVNAGDKIFAQGNVHTFTRGNADGQNQISIQKSSGTATVAFNQDGGIGHDWFSKATASMDQNISGYIRVTVSGTLVLSFNASYDAVGTSASIGANNGQMSALVLNGS